MWFRAALQLLRLLALAVSLTTATTFQTKQLSDNAVLHQLAQIEHIDVHTLEDQILAAITNDPFPLPVDCNLIKLCRENSTLFCHKACETGTVAISSWLQYATATQRFLQYDMPLDFVQMWGTHNSAITRANAYGVYDNALSAVTSLLLKKPIQWRTADQVISLTDQLNMGIRQIELDTHWLYKDDQLKICHAGTSWPALDEFIAIVNRLTGWNIEWDSGSLGCWSDYHRQFDEAVAEIAQWLSAHPDEIVVIMLDDQPDLGTWGKVPLIIESVVRRFSSVNSGDPVDSWIFTPPEKLKLFPDPSSQQFNWPTPRQLLQMGKRVVIASRANYAQNMSSVIFYRDGQSLIDLNAGLNFGNWTESAVSPFSSYESHAFFNLHRFDPNSLTPTFANGSSPYPVCSLADPDGRQMFTQTGFVNRILGDSLIWGPFHQDSSDGYFAPSIIPPFVDCGALWPCFDQATPVLMEATIFTWDANEPTFANNCTALRPLINQTARWTTSIPCSTQLPLACRSIADATIWLLTAPMSVNHVNPSSCPAGFEFAIPVNGYEQRHLQRQLTDSPVWLNFVAPSKWSSSYDFRRFKP